MRERMYPRYTTGSCDNGFRNGRWKCRWIIRLRRLGFDSKFIDYRNLFETSIETNTIENAIPFDRFYPLLSARYNLTVHRGISSYNHDRVPSVSLKWKIVRNAWLIATGFNGVEFTMIPALSKLFDTQSGPVDRIKHPVSSSTSHKLKRILQFLTLPSPLEF